MSSPSSQGSYNEFGDIKHFVASWLSEYEQLRTKQNKLRIENEGLVSCIIHVDKPAIQE